MGPQQVLRTAACALLIAAPASAGSGWKSAAPKLHEPVLLVDLGPDDQGRVLADALVEAGLDPVLAIDRDAQLLAAAMQQAEHAFGALKCGDAVKAANMAIGIAA